MLRYSHLEDSQQSFRFLSAIRVFRSLWLQGQKSVLSTQSSEIAIWFAPVTVLAAGPRS
jgi:hypothetical protein